MASEDDEMLRALGLTSVEELFADIPASVRTQGLDLPQGMSEQDVMRHVTSILRHNRSAEAMPTFLGAGLYDHFVPASVRAIASRSEFYTAYTPYQAELSQGMLQSLWEYQSFICELTGMDAANTSMYDASTALGEAALMAHRITGKRQILIPTALHWDKKAVLRSYAAGPGLEIEEVVYDPETGTLDEDALRAAVGEDTAAVYVENPNFFGRFEEELEEIRSIAPSLLIVGANPIALAVTKAPGDLGADIVIGEGQALGNAMNFGGPLIGIFACRQEHLRKMPGRVIGITKDANGDRAFCMTLQTREQHIRRERAMSNICTNEALMSVAAAVHIAVLGASGLRRVALDNLRRAKRLADRIDGLDRYTAPVFDGGHFNEFVVRSTIPYASVHRTLLEKGVHGGLPLRTRFPELGEAALFATTEVHTEADYEHLLHALEAVP
ncbi:MAG: glycine dehydrogenase (aminomethyl-transferring) [Euryarchaeota archaeon RBG_16_68_12]|nr:MAG: glycine dehydrogenase (aminomethyl-transferring) [Euryarchaeota archaeon RBG_16_68_12]